MPATEEELAAMRASGNVHATPPSKIRKATEGDSQYSGPKVNVPGKRPTGKPKNQSAAKEPQHPKVEPKVEPHVAAKLEKQASGLSEAGVRVTPERAKAVQECLQRGSTSDLSAKANGETTSAEKTGPTEDKDDHDDHDAEEWAKKEERVRLKKVAHARYMRFHRSLSSNWIALVCVCVGRGRVVDYMLVGLKWMFAKKNVLLFEIWGCNH